MQFQNFVSVTSAILVIICFQVTEGRCRGIRTVDGTKESYGYITNDIDSNNEYFPGEHCTWRVMVPEGARIRYVVSFRLSPNSILIIFF